MCMAKPTGKIQEGLFQFDPSAMSWTELSTAGAPLPRRGPGFASAFGRLLIFGGSTGAGTGVKQNGCCLT